MSFLRGEGSLARPRSACSRAGCAKTSTDETIPPREARSRALGQFASPCFVASGPASPQRTPTYASGCRPARASPDSQLAPVPRLTHHSVACLAAIGSERLGSVAGEEQAGAGEE